MPALRSEEPPLVQQSAFSSPWPCCHAAGKTTADAVRILTCCAASSTALFAAAGQLGGLCEKAPNADYALRVDGRFVVVEPPQNDRFWRYLSCAVVYGRIGSRR